MSNINFTVGNTSQVTVAPINADSTISQGSNDNSLVFGGVVVASKGAPFEIIRVNKENWKEKLGTPFHSSLGVHADSLRALNEATAGGDGVVVRVVPSTATYPIIKLAPKSIGSLPADSDAAKRIKLAEENKKIADSNLLAAQQNFKTAQADFSNESGDLSTAKIAKTKAGTALSNAQDAVDSASKTLASAKISLDTKSVAEKDLEDKVENATNAVSTAQAGVENAQRTFDTASSDVTGKKAAVTTATTAKGTAVTDKATADTTLADKQALLATADTDLQAKVKALATATTAKSDADKALTTATTAKTPVQKDIDDAQADLATKEAALVAATSAKKTAQDTFDAATTEVATAKTAADTAKTALETAISNLEGAEKAESDAEKAESDAQDALDTAKETLATATKNATALGTSLSNATAEKEAIEKVVAATQKTLDDAKADLAVKQQALDDATQAVTDAADHVADKQSLLDDCNDALEQAKTNLANKEQAFKVAIEKANEVQLNKVGITHEAASFDADLELNNDEFFGLAIKDGAFSDNRTVSIEQADEVLYGKDMFVLKLTETAQNGTESTLESFIVSLDPTATDQMGAAAYIETVLEAKSQYLVCVVNPVTAKKMLTSLEPTAFTGATQGELSDIKATDYDRAIEVLSNTVIDFNYVCGLACYDPIVHQKLIGICNSKRISGAFDINPRLTHAEALKFKQGLSLNEPRANYTHLPYTSTCPFYGNKVMYGMSGVVYRAKALGVAKSSPVGGWHYTPAGVDRATISRAGIAPMKGLDVPNFEEMYKARINKLGTSENGNLFLDDSLTSCAQENYLRFEQVVSTTDAISRGFYGLANRIKHQPDGITRYGLTDGMKTLLENFESIGALVTPRNPDQDGKEAFVFKVTQVEIDYWNIDWSICVTGSGRRFNGEPILVR